MNRYLVTTIRATAFQTAALPGHYQFLDRLRKQGLLELAGPFTDRTGAAGGAYVLRAADFAQAVELAHADPLHKTGSSLIAVREWNAH